MGSRNADGTPAWRHHLPPRIVPLRDDVEENRDRTRSGSRQGGEVPCLAHLFDEPDALEAGVSDAPEPS